MRAVADRISSRLRIRQQGVKMQSYRTLRDGKAFSDPTILGISKKHNRSAAQVLGRWCVQHGFIAIPKSVKEVRVCRAHEHHNSVAKIANFVIGPAVVHAATGAHA